MTTLALANEWRRTDNDLGVSYINGKSCVISFLQQVLCKLLNPKSFPVNKFLDVFQPLAQLLACVLVWALFPLPKACGQLTPEQTLEAVSRLTTAASFSAPLSDPKIPALSVELKPSPLEWLLSPKSGSRIERILAQLLRAEAHEPNLHFRADYRQTWIAIYLADVKHDPTDARKAFIESSRRCYGIDPDQVWPHIVADRKAKLGNEYSRWYDPSGNQIGESPFPESQPLLGSGAEIQDAHRESAPPKKPAESVGRDTERKSA